MPPVFYFMLFESYKHEHSTKLHYNNAKGIVTFNIFHTFNNNLPLPVNKSMNSCKEKVALLALQPLVHIILQCCIIQYNDICVICLLRHQQ